MSKRTTYFLTYVTHETVAGTGWSKPLYIGKKRNILAAIADFNKRTAKYSISTDQSKTDIYDWKGSKYGIHSCFENDGHNGVLVAVVFSEKQLDQKTLAALVDSYFFSIGPEWDELFAKLLEDVKFGSLPDKYLRYLIAEVEDSLTPGKILKPKNFARVKKSLLKAMR